MQQENHKLPRAFAMATNDPLEPIVTAMYGQPEGISMSLARYNLYTRKKGKPLRIMALPQTEANMLLHMRVHLQVMLWKAADRQGAPISDITKFGWDMKSGLPSPSLDTGHAAPDVLIDTIR